MSEPVFCQNCGWLCEEVHIGDNGLPYCSRDCEITDRLIYKYELPIILTIFMLCLATALTARYMIDKYSHTTQEQGRNMDDKEQ